MLICVKANYLLENERNLPAENCVVFDTEDIGIVRKITFF